MLEDFLNLLCAAFTSRVTNISLHTGDPGLTGAHDDTGVPHKAVTWTTADDGHSELTAAFTNISNAVPWTHIGLWEGATFRGAKPFPAFLPTPGNLTVLVSHKAAA